MITYITLDVHLDFDKDGLIAGAEYEDDIILVDGVHIGDLNEKIVRILTSLDYKGHVRLNYTYDSSVILTVGDSQNYSFSKRVCV